MRKLLFLVGKVSLPIREEMTREGVDKFPMKEVDRRREIRFERGLNLDR